MCLYCRIVTDVCKCFRAPRDFPLNKPQKLVHFSAVTGNPLFRGVFNTREYFPLTDTIGIVTHHTTTCFLSGNVQCWNCLLERDTYVCVVQSLWNSSWPWSLKVYILRRSFTVRTLMIVETPALNFDITCESVTRLQCEINPDSRWGSRLSNEFLWSHWCRKF